VKSDLLPYDIKYQTELDVQSFNKFSFESTYKGGRTVHSLKAEYSYSVENIEIELDIQTPILDIHRFNVESKISTGKIIRANTTITAIEKTHTVEIKFNPNTRKISCLVKSPYVKGETIKIETSVNGTFNDNLDFHALLRFDEKTFATKFNFKNTDKMYTSLEVKTPFRGYRKMNIVASYERKEKVIITFSASKPLNVKFDIELGKADEEYVAMINIVTPVKGYENVSLKAIVPVDKIHPKLHIKILDLEYLVEFEIMNEKYSKKLQFDVKTGSDHYSAGSQLRHKAPYALGYHYDVMNVSDKFHIMTDSSMLRAVLLPISGLY